MATLYKTDGTVIEVKPKKGKKFSYEELKGYVGDMIQMVPLGTTKLLVCHDEGKLIGLPKNFKATELWKQVYPISEYPINNDELVVGDVLVGESKELN